MCLRPEKCQLWMVLSQKNFQDKINRRRVFFPSATFPIVTFSTSNLKKWHKYDFNENQDRENCNFFTVVGKIESGK